MVTFTSAPGVWRPRAVPGKWHAGLAAFPALVSLFVWMLGGCGSQPLRSTAPEVQALSDSAWTSLVESLSEPGGYFDTDNLISNERSFLQVLAPLRDLPRGAYLGVGPDQNFSYMTAAKPSISFMIDIRRDNLLHHLLLRSLFDLSDDRAEYLARLHGRSLPPANSRWDRQPLEAILDYIESQPVDSAAVRETEAAIDSLLRALPLQLTAADFSTIHRFHQAFVDQGPQLRFETFGRPPRPGYPSFRDLLLETDADGEQGSYLISEENFDWMKDAEGRNLVVPVVGDLAGPHAVRAIAAWLRDHQIEVAAYYTSNVEFYLWREGTFPAFVENVRALPWSAEGLIIRSVFDPSAGILGNVTRRPGDISIQLAQPADAFLRAAGTGTVERSTSYERVVSSGAIELRSVH